MRSRAGVGTTPPKVPGAPKPTSSVMISSTLGAPLGGTTRGGHQAFDSEAFSLITPPNSGSGGGRCFPLMVVVALGEPNTPVTCWAAAAAGKKARATNNNPMMLFGISLISSSSYFIRVFFPNTFSNEILSSLSLIGKHQGDLETQRPFRSVIGLDNVIIPAAGN